MKLKLSEHDYDKYKLNRAYWRFRTNFETIFFIFYIFLIFYLFSKLEVFMIEMKSKLE